MLFILIPFLVSLTYSSLLPPPTPQSGSFLGLLLKSLCSYREVNFLLLKKSSISYSLYYNFFHLPYQEFNEFILDEETAQAIDYKSARSLTVMWLIKQSMMNPIGITKGFRKKLFWNIILNYHEYALDSCDQIAAVPSTVNLISLFPLKGNMAWGDLRRVLWNHALILSYESFHPYFPESINFNNVFDVLEQTKLLYSSQVEVIPCSFQTFLPRVLSEAIRLLCLEDSLEKSQFDILDFLPLIKQLHVLLRVKIGHAALKLVESTALKFSIFIPEYSLTLASESFTKFTFLSGVQFFLVPAEKRSQPVYSCQINNANVLQIFLSRNISEMHLISTYTKIKELIDRHALLTYKDLESILACNPLIQGKSPYSSYSMIKK